MICQQEQARDAKRITSAPSYSPYSSLLTRLSNNSQEAQQALLLPLPAKYRKEAWIAPKPLSSVEAQSCQVPGTRKPSGATSSPPSACNGHPDPSKPQAPARPTIASSYLGRFTQGRSDRHFTLLLLTSDLPVLTFAIVCLSYNFVLRTPSSRSTPVRHSSNTRRPSPGNFRAYRGLLASDWDKSCGAPQLRS